MRQTDGERKKIVVAFLTCSSLCFLAPEQAKLLCNYKLFLRESRIANRDWQLATLESKVSTNASLKLTLGHTSNASSTFMLFNSLKISNTLTGQVKLITDSSGGQRSNNKLLRFPYFSGYFLGLLQLQTHRLICTTAASSFNRQLKKQAARSKH